MPSLKDLRNRISSVKATQKITKAMQMVAAAKLRRAQEAAEAARPYAERMEEVIANLSASLGSENNSPGGENGASDGPPLLAGTGSEHTHLLVACTAERGLCGGFNSSIARLVRDDTERLIGEGKNVRILCVGRKGYDILRRQFSGNIADLIELRDVRRIGYGEGERIRDRVLNMFANGEFDICTLYYAEFLSVMNQKPHGKRLIPAPVHADSESTGEEHREHAGDGVNPGQDSSVYDYEPDEETILQTLLPRNVAVQIFRALLENAASEQGARMTAMDSATRNAGEMIDSLTLDYNRQRQAAITRELIEIISGAEAL